MVEAIRLVLPYLFLLYFVVKGIRKPLYFLAIPFLMFMSQSIFFEGVKLFKIPGKYSFALMFIWLVFLWIVSIILQRDEEKNEFAITPRLNVLDFCIIGLILISFFGLGLTIINHLNLTDVFKEFIILISLFICYFFIKDWSLRNKPELLVEFLFSLLIVNSIASVLYIIHQGLHFRIYLSEEYLTAIFDGKEITRTFWFMPQFLFFSVIFSLVFRAKSPILFTGLIILNLLATVITYLRSFSIIAVILFILYFLLVGLKKGRLGLVFKNILIYSMFGVLFFIMMLKFFPANTKYFMDRFSEITTPQLIKAPNNLDVRFTNTGAIISNMDDNKKFFGMGPVTESQVLLVRYMRQALADMTWAGIIFRWGFIGMILFLMLYIYSIIKAFNIYMKSEGVLSDLALVFLLFVISQLFQSFIDWTFMSNHGFAVGLWYFAMLSALIGFNENKKFLIKQI